VAAAPRSADAAVREGRIVLQKGDTVPGLTGGPIALYVDEPTVTGTGKVGFRGQISIGNEAFIFIDDAAVHRDADCVGISPSSSDDQIGVADGGKFIYIAYATKDYAYTHDGIVLTQGDDAPSYTTQDVGYLYYPQMTADGSAYVFSTITASGSTSTVGEAIFKIADGGSTVTPLLRGGDVVDGTIIESSGLDYDFHVSPNGAHYIAFVDLATGSTTNDYAIVKDDLIVMQEGVLVNSVEYWQYFDLVYVNNSGNYVVSGDTSGNSVKDEAIAYNGDIVLREGETVDGITLNSTSYVYGLGINEDDHVYHHWYTSGLDRVFVTCDPSEFKDRSRLILENGDEIDLDDDNVGDITINDIRTSSSTRIGFGTGQVAYFEVSFTDGVGTSEGIIEVPYGCCGNMMLEGPEECDDGNDVNNDGCTNACTISDCGDGILDTTPGSTEECDDGNSNDEDACTNSCTLPDCGDGITSGGAGEECDDQNQIDDDGCTNACTLPACGDGILHTGEQCDDGNAIDGDDCTNACTNPRCGDGVVQMGEACDDGNTDDNDDCRNNCSLATCGDGVVQAPEECDDGNATNDDECSDLCLLPFCGDGIIQMGEACDDGNLDDTDECTTICRNAICGDGITNADEECDDGNQSQDDDCTNGCTIPGCGDGIKQPGEECDDGNSDDYDSCNSMCEGSSCGDGVVQAPDEECDDGNMSNDDACTNACVLNDDIGATGGDDGGTGDTDGMGGGGGGGDGGGCSVEARREPATGWLLAVAGLGLLGFGRRRRR